MLLLLPFVANAVPLLTNWSANPLYFVSRLSIGARDTLLPGTPGWIDPNVGFTLQSLGGLAAQDWLNGKVPWWNPFSGVGMPLAAEAQPTALFLPFVLLLSLENGTLLFKIVLQVVAGLASYALLRHLRLVRRSALLGALLYELCSSFAWFGDAPMAPTAFLPLFILGIEHALAAARRRRRGGWAVLGVALAYSLYAGFPETAYLNGLLALSWAVLRLATAARIERLAFMRKVAIGGSCGLLAAMPLLLPFAQFVLGADLSDRMNFDRLGLDLASFAGFLLPYTFGPIFGFHDADPSGRIFEFWSNVGGYVGITVTLLAVLAVLSPARERALRWMLGAWIVVCLLRTAAVPFVCDVISWIPAMPLTAFYRYAQPTWSFAAIVLAAFAIDDWLRNRALPVRAFRTAAALTAIAGLLAMGAALPVIVGTIRSSASFWPYPVLSSFWAVSVFAGLALFYRQGAERRRGAVSAILVIDALMMFGATTLSGNRNHAVDLGAVDFLRRNLGLQRFYTLGPFAPNYGAYFSLASINHEYEPVPRAWRNFIRAHLDPGVKPITFVGYYPPVGTDGETRQQALQRRMAEYADIGVKYVIAPPGEAPLREPEVETVAADWPGTPLMLRPGDEREGWTPDTLAHPGKVWGFGVVVGTYGGSSDGNLLLELCSTSGCVESRIGLRSQRDNHVARFRFAHPLVVPGTQPLRYSLRYEAGTSPMAVWLWKPSMAGFAKRSGQLTPHLSLSYDGRDDLLRPVYSSAALEIFELPDPAPYFETRGGVCRLDTVSREEAHAVCDAPATLIRRELFLPGWQVELNGNATALGQSGPLFQMTELPAGESRVTFSYAPPFAAWTLLPFAIGVIGCFAGLQGAPLRAGAISFRQRVPEPAASHPS